jgi:hypothetical protein
LRLNSSSGSTQLPKHSHVLVLCMISCCSPFECLPNECHEA